MSKAKAIQPKSNKEISGVYYRADRKSSYAWQCYRLTVYSDGSIIEDIPLKEDVLHITFRKIAEMMKSEGQVCFDKLKAQWLADETARVEDCKKQLRKEIGK